MKKNLLALAPIPTPKTRPTQKKEQARQRELVQQTGLISKKGSVQKTESTQKKEPIQKKEPVQKKKAKPLPAITPAPPKSVPYADEEVIEFADLRNGLDRRRHSELYKPLLHLSPCHYRVDRVHLRRHTKGTRLELSRCVRTRGVSSGSVVSLTVLVSSLSDLTHHSWLKSVV